MSIWSLHGGMLWKNGDLCKNNIFSIQVDNDDQDRDVLLQEQDIITPGLFDLHCHLQGIRPTWAGTNNILGLGAEAYLFDGIYGCADAGSYGYDLWNESDELWQMSRIQIKSWLNVLPEGLTRADAKHTLAKDIDLDRLITTFNQANGRLIGYKYMHGLSGGDPQIELDWLKLVKAASRAVGAPVMVHLTGGPLSIDTIIDELDPGDILAHIYNGVGPGGTVLDDDGHVKASVLSAAEKGILFELDAGFKHIDFNVFRKAYAEGVQPHFLATDTTCNNWKILPVYGMAHFLAEAIQLGIPVEMALTCAIDRPCKYMGFEQDLSKNIVVLKWHEQKTAFQDNIAAKHEFNGSWDFTSEYCVFKNQSIKNNF